MNEQIRSGEYRSRTVERVESGRGSFIETSGYLAHTAAEQWRESVRGTHKRNYAGCYHYAYGSFTGEIGFHAMVDQKIVSQRCFEHIMDIVDEAKARLPVEVELPDGAYIEYKKRKVGSPGWKLVVPRQISTNQERLWSYVSLSKAMFTHHPQKDNIGSIRRLPVRWHIQLQPETGQIIAIPTITFTMARYDTLFKRPNLTPVVLGGVELAPVVPAKYASYAYKKQPWHEYPSFSYGLEDDYTNRWVQSELAQPQRRIYHGIDRQLMFVPPIDIDIRSITPKLYYAVCTKLRSLGEYRFRLPDNFESHHFSDRRSIRWQVEVEQGNVYVRLKTDRVSDQVILAQHVLDIPCHIMVPEDIQGQFFISKDFQQGAGCAYRWNGDS